MRRGLWVVIATLSLLGLAGSARADAPAAGSASLWTVTQAESIASVRGLRVHVRRCEGLGRGRQAGAATVYGAFACLAGARLASQPVDTVAVTYVLRPLGPFKGRASAYVLTDVHFGGLGVP